MASMELEITVQSAMELKNVNWPNGGLLPYTKVFLNRVETGRRYSDTKSTGTDFSGSTIPVWNKTLVFRIKEYHIPRLAANFRVSHLLPPGPRNPAAKAVVGSASLPLTHLFGSGSSGSNWLYGYGQGVDRNVQLFRPSGRPQGILFIKAVLVPCPQVVTTNMYDDSFFYFASELYRRGLYNMLKMNDPDSANSTDSNTCYCMSCCQRHVAAEAAMRCGTMEEDQENAVNYTQNMDNPDFANDRDSYLASQQQRRRYDVQNTTNPDSSNNDDDFYLAQQQQRQYGADNVNNPDSANGDDDFYMDSQQQQQQRYDMQNTMSPDSSNNDYDIYLAQHQLWQYGVDNVNNFDSANDKNDFHFDSQQQQQYDVHNMDNLNSANSNHNNNHNNCYGMTCAPAEATTLYNSTLDKYRQYSTEPTTEVATTSYSHYQEDEDSKLDVLTGAVADLSLKKKHEEEEEEEEEDEEGEEEEEEKEEGVELKEKQKTEESAESNDMDREDYYSADDDNDDYIIV